MVRVVHAGDFHLDSAFGALTPEQARQRRMESRRTPERLVEWANDHGADLLLLSGDLFDSDSPYGDTAPLLAQALGCFRGQAVIAPGNHDPLTPDGPYARTRWSDNVHIFTEDRMQTITFPDLNCAVHGAAFTAPECPTDSVLPGFRVPQDGLIHIGLLHGDVTTSDSRYRPIRAADIAGSGLDYLALGHVHSCSGVYWMITSGCTGWAPNEARMFKAASLWGPWEQLPSPFVGKDAKKSFHTQGTYIFKVEGTEDGFVFMADRWNPQSLKNSRHIWLPIDFEADGTPVIRWVDSWSPKEWKSIR